MAIRFTDSQQRVIDSRGRNLLVSAAAGSGKTAVLVERIIQLITDKERPLDIDRLVVVTFTDAAAGEMRERIGAAIEEKLKEEPENLHLQRQATLIHHALITTIHSFCLFVIRNNFNDIGLDPGFRVADTGELELIKQDVLKEIFEKRLENQETKQDFTLLLDTLAAGGSQKGLEELILRLYTFSQSFPWPKRWLKQRLKDYRIPEGGIEHTDWGKLLAELLKGEWQQLTEAIEETRLLCRQEGGPALYEAALESDLETVSLLATKDFGQQYVLLKDLKFARLSGKKQEGVEEEKKEAVKQKRERIKEDIKAIRERYFPFSPEGLEERMKEIQRVEQILVEVVLEFADCFEEKKREKNLIDFSDMEHFALEILTEQLPEGEQTGEDSWIPSKTAIDYRTYFQEIMIDEYQDSNLVQEYLLKSISGEWEGRYNRFMVGDLKQSIYKFRMARPEIFLEKYEAYTREESERQCIPLHQNFRSRKQVLDSVNAVFEQLMTKELGKIDYTSEEALHEGAEYPAQEEPGTYTTELLLLEKPEREERKAEAKMVAHRIGQLMKELKITDKETGELRDICYRDIVILLRSSSGWDEVFYQELAGAGIPVMLTSKTGYFQAKEVQILLNFLKVIDNPRQDIPLYGVMTSLLGRFTREEIAWLRKGGEGCLYDNLVRAAEGEATGRTEESQEEEEASQRGKAGLGEKCRTFLASIRSYRRKVAIIPIHQLLREYLKETGYLYSFMALPGGEQKAANVNMLVKKAEAYEKTSYFGLFHFIRYMEQLQKYEVDSGEAGLADEGQDAVKIMTIHKSKGLEFPVCFLCGLHKPFNQQDSRQACIMDMDLGLGLEYRNPVKRIRCTDLRKNVIARKLELENLGEELRVLYVAMTRAKEKLILTGLVKDYEKQMLSYSSLENRRERKLPFSILTHSQGYLNWILAAVRRPCPSIRVVNWDTHRMGEELKGKAIKQEWLRLELEKKLEEYGQTRKEESSRLKEALSFTYAHNELQGLYAKTTVSELKKRTMEILDKSGEGAHELFAEKEVIPYLPAFMEEEKKVAGTTRGTAYHRVLELIDYSRLSDWNSLHSQMEELAQRGVLDRDYLPLLQKEKMEAFLGSGLAERMKKADKEKRLFREKPFVLGLPASLLDDRFPQEEKVLIQGIIDAWFEEEGELVLVDYKTDRISAPEELLLRYRGQLKYYQMALEQLTGKKVKEKLLYSFALGRAIVCP